MYIIFYLRHFLFKLNYHDIHRIQLKPQQILLFTHFVALAQDYLYQDGRELDYLCLYLNYFIALNLREQSLAKHIYRHLPRV